MWSWLRNRRAETEPKTEEIAMVDERTGPITIGSYSDGRPMRVVLAGTARAQAALAAFRSFEPSAFDWAGRFYVGDEVNEGRAFVAVWNSLHPHRRTVVWDLDVVLAEADAVGVLAGQRRGSAE